MSTRQVNRFIKFFYALNKVREPIIWYLLLWSSMLGLTVISPYTFAIGQETEGSVVISVRDIETGYALPAFISISKVEEDGSTSHVIDSFQAPLDEILKSYPPGKYNIELKMEGYKTMKSWFTIEVGKNFINRYMLSPVESLSESQDIRKLKAISSTMAVINGYITDDQTGQPIGGVHIFFEKTGIDTYTDQGGYFEAAIPVEETLRFNEDEIKALQETIVFSLTGYKTLKEINVLIIAGHLLNKNITMFKGDGEIIHDRTHPMLL